MRGAARVEVTPLTLGEFPHPQVRVACRYCERRGRYVRDRLIGKHGPGMTIDDFLRMIAADCGWADTRTGRRGCSGPYVMGDEEA